MRNGNRRTGNSVTADIENTGDEGIARVWDVADQNAVPQVGAWALGVIHRGFLVAFNPNIVRKNQRVAVPSLLVNGRLVMEIDDAGGQDLSTAQKVYLDLEQIAFRLVAGAEEQPRCHERPEPVEVVGDRRSEVRRVGIRQIL